jgi:prolyl-tRNA synthetase
MGSYGIGVERAIAAIAECHYDDAGLRWPVQVAPAEATVILLSTRDEAARAAATGLYDDLLSAGVDAVLDDREERPGVKFKDAELTGIPYRLTVGSRDLADGLVEITSRASGEKERVAVTAAIGHLRGILRP